MGASAAVLFPPRRAIKGVCAAKWDLALRQRSCHQGSWSHKSQQMVNWMWQCSTRSDARDGLGGAACQPRTSGRAKDLVFLFFKPAPRGPCRFCRVRLAAFAPPAADRREWCVGGYIYFIKKYGAHYGYYGYGAPMD